MTWLDRHLAAAGIERTGEVEQPHLRPWATVLRAPTTSGDVWLKAAGPATAAEVGLYPLLQRVVPDHVLAPIAVDLGRGWIVLPDGGPSLAQRLDEIDLAGAMERVLPPYGELQRRLGPYVERMLALGLMDMRPAIMPRRFDEALVAADAYVGRWGGGDDRRALRRLQRMRATVRSWSERLATLPGEPTVDHNDVHQWNVLVGSDGLDKPRLFDWGDAVVAHPARPAELRARPRRWR